MPESSSATSSRPKTARQNSALTKNLHPCKNCQQYRKGCDRTDWTDWTSSSNSCKHCCGKKSCEPGDWAISNPTSHTEGMQIILCDPSSPSRKERKRSSSTRSITAFSAGSPSSTILETPGKFDLPLPEGEVSIKYQYDNPYKELCSSPTSMQSPLAESPAYSGKANAVPVTPADCADLPIYPNVELTPVHMRPATELSSGTYAHHNIEGSQFAPFKSSSSSLHNWDGKVTQVGGVTRVHRVHRLLDESRSISGFTHDPSMSEELEELNTLDYQCRV